MKKTKIKQQAKHTPGPWHVRTDREFYKDHVQPFCICSQPEGVELNPHWQDNHRYVCRLMDSWDEQAKADAALIASAPELLQACKLLLAFTVDVLPQSEKLCIQDFKGLNEGLILAEQAIKKAQTI